MHALSDILTPAQKAKMAELRAAARASGGYGGGSGGGAAPGTPPATPPASAPAPAPTGAPAPSTAAAPPAGRSGGADPSARMARLSQFLGLDADQQAKAKAIFAEGPSPEAFAKFRAILRPDQQAKLDARRAQREHEGGGNQ
jgi:hypothetical protein